MAEGVRKHGNTWQYRFSRVVHSKRKNFVEGGFQTQREAIDARNEAIVDFARTGKIIKNKDLLYDDMFKEFLIGRKLDSKPSTIKRYKSLYNTHIKSAFGDIKISRIDRDMLADFIMSFDTKRKVNGDKYSREYIKGFKKHLYAVFEYCFLKDYIKYNYMERVSVPKYIGREKVEKVILEQHELDLLQTRFKNTNQHMAVHLAYRYGLRVGEIYGLTWDDILIIPAKLEVKRQMQSIVIEDNVGNERNVWAVVDPKTAKSIRTLDIIPEDIAYFKAARKEQQIARRAIGADEYNKDTTYRFNRNQDLEILDCNTLNFIMRDPKGHRYTPDSVKLLSKIAKNDFNINFNMHQLRYAHATILILLGFEHTYVHKRMGHSNIQTTLDIYVKLSKELQEVAIDKLKNFPRFKDVSPEEVQKIKELATFEREEGVQAGVQNRRKYESVLDKTWDINL